MRAWTGGCLCGAVRCRIDADPLTGVACHCRDGQYVSATRRTRVRKSQNIAEGLGPSAPPMIFGFPRAAP